MRIFTSTHDSVYEFEMHNTNGKNYISRNKKPLNVRFKKLTDGRFMLIKDNQPFKIHIEKSDDAYNVSVNGQSFRVSVEDAHSMEIKKLLKSSGGGQSEKTINAQIPGLIVDIPVQKGDQVKNGAPLLILEAMKMENIIKAPYDCRIIDIMVNPKDTVNQNQALIKIKA